jgi:hypothetical protein
LLGFVGGEIGGGRIKSWKNMIHKQGFSTKVDASEGGHDVPKA